MQEGDKQYSREGKYRCVDLRTEYFKSLFRHC